MNALPDPLPRSQGDVRPMVQFQGHPCYLDPMGTLYFSNLSVLVVSDMHLEKGSSFAQKGSFVPPYDSLSTLNKLEPLIAFYQPQTVILLGDSFHDQNAEARLPECARAKLIDMFDGRSVFWIAGNHDPAPPQDVPGIAAEQVAIERLIFRHIPTQGDVNGEIAGHLHPGARIARRGRLVRRRCFAMDEHRIIMPAFGAYTGSLNVKDSAFSGLFGKQDYDVYLLGKEKVHHLHASQIC